MSASPQASGERPPEPVLVISDRLDLDPVGLLPSAVPLRQLPSLLFTTAEYEHAPLVLLDDRAYTNFLLRHAPQRHGLIVVLADPDDTTVHPRAMAIGAEAVVRAGRDPAWLHLRMHAATDCRYARWETLLADPPPPEGI
ncbi:hypothetical protein [Streptomyces sp. NPDC094468]|uniref:hypothetical protein n=1 Tax=Streptomyces sp. NPDC094468 TaxID=3366066 RepID=UPI0038047C8D